MTRADGAFNVSDLQQAIRMPTVSLLRRANLARKRLIAESGSILIRSSEGPLRINAIGDAAFENMLSNGSQSGVVVRIEEDVGTVDGMGTVVAWSSRRLKRVVSSTRSAELPTTLENAHVGILVSVMMAKLEGFLPWAVTARGPTEVIKTATKCIPVICTTDAHDTATALRTEREVEAEKDLNVFKRQMQNLMQLDFIRGVIWVPDICMPVDALTKGSVTASKRAMLRDLMEGKNWVPSETDVTTMSDISAIRSTA